MSASTTISPAGSGTLPTPKVRLGNNQYFEVIDLYDIVLDSVIGAVKLFRPVEVVAYDVTQEQIDRGLYLEMLAYKAGKSKASIENNDSSYKVPSQTIGGINAFDGNDVRGGVNYNHNAPRVPISVDRINQINVSARNEVLPAWKMLNNRFTEAAIRYRDTSGNYQAVQCVTPCSRRGRHKYFGKSFMYSSEYSPYYVCFRFVMNNEDGGKEYSALSRVVKICHDTHPFVVDGAASNLIGLQCGDINSSFDKGLLRCYFETRLP